jgi:hypothetical protein
MYPKIVVFFMALTVLVGGTVMLLNSVPVFEVFSGLNGVVGVGIQDLGKTLGKIWLSS